MNYEKKDLVLTFFEKIVIYLLLLSFILLNILDFFNFFSLISPYTGDVDFFKKILSWSLIYYLFASLSLTKILTGFRTKLYDWFLLTAAGLITFPSILIFYLRNIDFELYYIFSFIINEYFLIFLLEHSIVFVTFGIVLLVVMSVYIFLKQPVHKESLIGSFNLDPDNYFSQINKFAIIIIFIFFFVYTIFKFFMEWFALAVDAALIVIGVGYYVYIYIFKHKKNLSLDSFLKDIINTGNDFFKQLILFLQDKKTFFITISLLITIHLLVDLGVYIIPFATGIDNGLYNILGGDNDIKPLFSLSGSIIEEQYYNLFQNSNFEIVPSLVLFIFLVFELIIFLVYILLFFIFLTLPFYILFLNLKGDVFIPSKKMILFVLSMVIIQFFLFFIGSLDNPIEFSISNSGQMQGVVFKTQPFFVDLGLINFQEFLISVIAISLLLTFILSMLYRKYEKYKSFFISSFYLVILVFFLFYSSVFAQSFITQLYHSSIEDTMFTYNFELDKNSQDYLEVAMFIHENDNMILNESLKNLFNNVEGIELRSTLFKVHSGIINIEPNSRFSNSDFIGFQLIIEDDNILDAFKKSYTFSTFSLAMDGIDLYIYEYGKLFTDPQSMNEIWFILEFDTSKYVIQEFYDRNPAPRMTNKSFNLVLTSKNPPTPVEQAVRIASLLIFIFTSLFYVGGLIAYAVYYRKILEKLKQKLF